MILSTKGKAILAVASGRAPKGFPPDILKRAALRLRAINNAEKLDRETSVAGSGDGDMVSD